MNIFHFLFIPPSLVLFSFKFYLFFYFYIEFYILNYVTLAKLVKRLIAEFAVMTHGVCYKKVLYISVPSWAHRLLGNILLKRLLILFQFEFFTGSKWIWYLVWLEWLCNWLRNLLHALCRYRNCLNCHFLILPLKSVKFL